MDGGDDVLFVEKAGIQAVNVHPVVLFSILEQHLRREEEESRVIGTLLGSVSGGVLEITNCFGVPFHESEVQIKTPAAAESLALHRQMNPCEALVGWYSTSTDDSYVTDATCAVHDYYIRENQRAVLLVVNTSLSASSVPIKAFVSTPSQLLLKSKVVQFQEVQVNVVATDAEKVGLDALHSVTSESGDLPSDSEQLAAALSQLLATLDGALGYVNDVVAGRVEGDVDVGRRIAHALSSVPIPGADLLGADFKAAVHEIAMVTHVAKLALAEVVVADKVRP